MTINYNYLVNIPARVAEPRLEIPERNTHLGPRPLRCCPSVLASPSLPLASWHFTGSSASINGVCYTCPGPGIITQESNGVATCNCVDANGKVIADESCTVSNDSDCSDDDSDYFYDTDDDTDDDTDVC